MQLSLLATMAALIGKSARVPVVISIMGFGPNPEQLARLEHESALMADTLPPSPWLRVDPGAWGISADIMSMSRYVLGGAAVLSLARKLHPTYQALSRRTRSRLILQGFPPEQVVYISGSVDADRFHPDPARRAAASEGRRVIVCTTRLAYEKGVDVLLHAWGRMKRSLVEWPADLDPKLRIVGDGPLRKQLEKIAAELGIADSVEFLGWRMDTIDLLQHSWGFVLPSRWEGMPNALLEAMACGLPCVATRVSGSEDIIDDGVDGLLVEPEQPTELAEALRRVIQDTELAERLGHEARAKIVRDYQVVDVVEQCVALYRGLLRQAAGAPTLAAQKSGVDE
jgi:glycosyltransferase involved in cell wall biosynthesis